jgi:hypothetical protein
MTKDKAQKRAVRARMTKTGEAYTTARHYLLDQRLPQPEYGTDDAPPGEPPAMMRESPAVVVDSSPLPPRVADPGMSDEAIQRGTGLTWDKIFAHLDAWGAAGRTHPEIARYAAEEFGISGWWAQGVTVGYERARGMRKRHEHTDGYSVSVGKTFACPLDELFAHFADDERRARWLEPEIVRPRGATASKAWRGEAADGGSRVEARFTSKLADKTAVAVEHTRLSAEEDVAVWRAFWKERLERLAASLS